MRKIIDGEECVMGVEALDVFECAFDDLKIWRAEGMPVKRGIGKSKWAYPILRCQAWFRGENDGDVGTV